MPVLVSKNLHGAAQLKESWLVFENFPALSDEFKNLITGERYLLFVLRVLLGSANVVDMRLALQVPVALSEEGRHRQIIIRGFDHCKFRD